jgi:histidinol dehydrogenase
MRILKLVSNVEAQLLRAREGRDEEAMRVAVRVVTDLRRRGDSALFAWARKYDGANLKRDGVWVAASELRAAQKSVSADFVRSIKHAAANVRKVAEKQLPGQWSIDVEPGVRIGQIVRPLDSVGCYIPGGRNALFSTLVMTVIPAQVAGVEKIVVVCPKPNDEILAAASLLGVARVARIGGPQAIAALAYGTKSVPRVDKIVGPGNRFVTAAKQLVSHNCAIDLPAGPTEAVVLAEKGNPRWIAADLLAQAEHAPDAGSFFVTTSPELARKVQDEVASLLATLPESSPARTSIEKTGAIMLAGSLKRAMEFVNRFAPEHLSLPENHVALLKSVRASGTVFTGPLAAQSFGDYASGSNHVLPTGGWARMRGGLSSTDFVKCISVQNVDRRGFTRLANDVALLARAENLPAHAAAVEVRR